MEGVDGCMLHWVCGASWWGDGGSLCVIPVALSEPSSHPL